MASTIQVDNIKDIGGNTIISSNGSGTFTSNLSSNVSSVTGTLPIANGGTGAATFAAAGLANTPAFLAQKSSTQSVDSDSTTKVTFTEEIFDSNGTYDTSNSRFTPGVAGKYCISSQIGFENMSDAKYCANYLYVNGSTLNSRSMGLNVNGADTTQDLFFNFTYIVNASATDYYEIYTRHNNGSSRNTVIRQQCFFQAYKIIGA